MLGALEVHRVSPTSDARSWSMRRRRCLASPCSRARHGGGARIGCPAAPLRSRVVTSSRSGSPARLAGWLCGAWLGVCGEWECCLSMCCVLRCLAQCACLRCCCCVPFAAARPLGSPRLASPLAPQRRFQQQGETKAEPLTTPRSDRSKTKRKRTFTQQQHEAKVGGRQHGWRAVPGRGVGLFGRWSSPPPCVSAVHRALLTAPSVGSCLSIDVG